MRRSVLVLPRGLRSVLLLEPAVLVLHSIGQQGLDNISDSKLVWQLWLKSLTAHDHVQPQGTYYSYRLSRGLS